MNSDRVSSAGDEGGREAVQRTLGDVHRDVEFGIRFRLELDKTLLALAAAVFAFTIAFPPRLVQWDDLWLLAVGWAGLALSMLGGFFEMHGWERFYLTYRDFEFRDRNGQPTRDRITFWRRIARVMQFAGFIVGVFAIGIFVLANMENLPVPG